MSDPNPDAVNSTRIVIPHRWQRDPCWSGDAISMRDAVQKAVKAGAVLDCAVLNCAKLRRADLRGADLRGADLRRADLRGADLRGADLRGADLTGANLAVADLAVADLAVADLTGTNLTGANLAGANLIDANLIGANLDGAHLDGAHLDGANLDGANLDGANLAGAMGAELAIARTRILPAGTLIVWKKCRGGVLVRLEIPAEAKRSHAFGRKCRAEFARVLEVIGADVARSTDDAPENLRLEYRPGETVRCHEWCDDWQRECAGGIHFYITRQEAEHHS